MADSYFIPDTTGINPAYKVQGDIYTINRTGMIIDFHTPIFYSSLKIVSSGNDGHVWADPADYVISERDDTAEARCINLDGNFISILARSIKVTGSIDNPIQVSISYQTLYPSTPVPTINAYDGAVNLTPDTIRDFSNRLMSVENKAKMIGATTIPKDAVVKALPWDIDCERKGNVVTETYKVDTAQGINTIFPTQGAFFKDSVVITPDGSEAYTLDSDFYVGDFDHYKTRLSTNHSGVYNCIVILANYAGELTVKYHAVGGHATVEDIRALRNSQHDIVTFLNGNQFLTSGMLVSDPSIENIMNRILLLEESMRAFREQPIYGVTSSGTTVTRNFLAPDTQLHWWSLASLYTVGDDKIPFTADTFKCHIEMPDRHLQTDLIINVDILNKTTPLKVSSVSTHYDQGYVPYGTSDSITPMPILFRIIYNETADNSSGVILQIGSALPSLSEKFGITDNSGVESAWQLVLPNSTEAATPDDTYPLQLPNDARYWNTTGDQSKVHVSVLPLDEGYRVWEGSEPLTSILTTNNQSLQANSELKPWVPLDKVTSFDIYYNNQKLNISANFTNGTVTATSPSVQVSDKIDVKFSITLTNEQLTVQVIPDKTTDVIPQTVVLNYVIANIDGTGN